MKQYPFITECITDADLINTGTWFNVQLEHEVHLILSHEHDRGTVVINDDLFYEKTIVTVYKDIYKYYTNNIKELSEYLHKKIHNEEFQDKLLNIINE